MGKGRGARTPAAAFAAVLLSLAGCTPAPVKPAPGHIHSQETRPAGAVPQAVQVAPMLPQPTPALRPETYSVVVNNVRVQDLLFALARDARIQVDIHPDVSGSITLNAIDQTLPQLLSRIARQVDMRYEMDGQTLSVMRDLPFLRSYRIDYVSASRNVTMQSTASSQFGGSGGGASGGGTGATATVNVVSNNQLWDQIVVNVRQILEDTDVVALPAPAASQAPAAPAGAPGAAPAPPPAPAGPSVRVRESASVIGNRESGVLYVRATARQHERVQEFLDQVLASTRRQVLIEATIAEVQLNNQYQRGIDWTLLQRAGATAGLSFRQTNPLTLPSAVDTTTGFVISGATGPARSANFVLNALKLLESFGDIRVLSSPKISVLNNQIALLRVTRDIVYFTITPSSAPVTIAAGAGGTGNVALTAFSTTPNVAAEGLMMSVLPQINDAESVVLNVRPTIRRRVDFANDPNPALVGTAGNRIPIFETREMDSILRLQSGQIAVLGGLMQDTMTNTEDGIPGARGIPGIGELFGQRSNAMTKTELVIFLRATVIRDPSVDGDFRDFREQMPNESFLVRPNPALRDAAPRAP